jgi:hypothetical protein
MNEILIQLSYPRRQGNVLCSVGYLPTLASLAMKLLMLAKVAITLAFQMCWLF